MTNPENGAGATVDHTLGTENGGYVFMKTTFTKGYKGFFYLVLIKFWSIKISKVLFFNL